MIIECEDGSPILIPISEYEGGPFMAYPQCLRVKPVGPKCEECAHYATVDGNGYINGFAQLCMRLLKMRPHHGLDGCDFKRK